VTPPREGQGLRAVHVLTARVSHVHTRHGVNDRVGEVEVEAAHCPFDVDQSTDAHVHHMIDGNFEVGDIRPGKEGRTSANVDIDSVEPPVEFLDREERDNGVVRDLDDLHRSLDQVDVNDLHDVAATAHTFCAFVLCQIGGKTRESEPVARILGSPDIAVDQLLPGCAGLWPPRLSMARACARRVT
jgi:hypothetical protein